MDEKISDWAIRMVAERKAVAFDGLMMVTPEAMNEFRDIIDAGRVSFKSEQDAESGVIRVTATWEYSAD